MPGLLPVIDHSDTVLDPAWAISLVRAFLPGPPAAHAHQHEAPRLSREQAGEALWDLAANAASASLLADLQLLQFASSLAEEAVRSQEYRLVELLLGILANISCHEATAALVAGNEEIRCLNAQLLSEIEDSQTLTESCRLASACVTSCPSPELTSSLEGCLPRLIWIVNNTLNEALLDRSLELLRLLLDESGTCRGLALAAGAQPALSSTVEAYAVSLAASGSDWDDDATQPSNIVPTVAAAVHAIICLDAFTGNREAGLHSMQHNDNLSSSLLLLLQHSSSLVLLRATIILLANLTPLLLGESAAAGLIQSMAESAGALDSLVDLLERLQEDDQTERGAVRHLMAAIARWHSQHGLVTSEIALVIAKRAAIIATRDAGVVHCYEDSLDSLVHWSAAIGSWLDGQAIADAEPATQLASARAMFDDAAATWSSLHQQERTDTMQNAVLDASPTSVLSPAVSSDQT